MVIRVAAGFVVIFAVGAILAADETIARSGGGFAGGRPATSPAAIHPTGARPSIHPGGATGGRAALRSHAFGRRSFRNRDVGFGWPWWSAGPWYEPYYNPTPSLGPSNDLAPYDAPPPGPGFPAMGYRTPYSAPTSVYVIPYRPGCDSQTQSLPWTGGEERAVTIVRC
jgi:hypothetical protein